MANLSSTIGDWKAAPLRPVFQRIVFREHSNPDNIQFRDFLEVLSYIRKWRICFYENVKLKYYDDDLPFLQVALGGNGGGDRLIS